MILSCISIPILQEKGSYESAGKKKIKAFERAYFARKCAM